MTKLFAFKAIAAVLSTVATIQGAAASGDLDDALIYNPVPAIEIAELASRSAPKTI